MWYVCRFEVDERLEKGKRNENFVLTKIRNFNLSLQYESYNTKHARGPGFHAINILVDSNSKPQTFLINTLTYMHMKP